MARRISLVSLILVLLVLSVTLPVPSDANENVQEESPPSKHSVTLPVADAVGHTSTRTFVLRTTESQPPNVSVDHGFPVVGENITFEANVTDMVGTPRVRWEFPNETFRTGATVTHTFNSSGRKNITVIATGEYGARTKKNVTVLVREHYPFAAPNPVSSRELLILFLSKFVFPIAVTFLIVVAAAKLLR